MPNHETQVRDKASGGDRKPIAMNADALKRLRTDAGLTQQQLANRAGLNEKHYWRIEAGTRDLWSTTLRSIAEALAQDLPLTVAEILDELTKP